MAKYLVTGAAGFIGSRVSEMLIAEGNQVVGVDNLNDAYDVRLKHRRLAGLTPQPNFSFHTLDICDQPAMERLFAGQGPFAAVINLAARAGVRYSVEDPQAFYQTNIMGLLNLLELCRRHEVKKFVLASSSSVYGRENPLPYQEDADTNRPLSPYAASKKGAEMLCYSYKHLHHLDFTIFRYFTVYGPAGRPDMSLFRFVQWIAEDQPVLVTGDGSQMRDFTYIDDIARGTIAGLRPNPSGYEIFNLGDDEPHALIDTIRLIEARLGKKANIVYKPTHPADVPATRASIARAQRLLGWRPLISLEVGLNRLIDWYLKERSWAKLVKTE